MSFADGRAVWALSPKEFASEVTLLAQDRPTPSGSPTLVIVLTDPWNTGKVLTWLSGSTWGRSATSGRSRSSWPSSVRRCGSCTGAWTLSSSTTPPRLLGVPLERTRLLLLGMAAVLVATSVTAFGVVVFVGLVAPHVARALVGGRHALVLPVAAGLGRCWSASPTPSAAPSSRRPRSPRAWSPRSSAPPTSSGCWRSRKVMA